MGFLSWLFPKTSSRLNSNFRIDPNKVAPIMAQFPASQDWPAWCRLTNYGPHAIKTAILSDLPKYGEHKDGMTLKEEVADIRLKRLTHYKCKTDWNHEFIRADFLQVSTNKPLVALWERDLAHSPDDEDEPEWKSKLKLKYGAHRESVDRVIYVTEPDFAAIVKIKKATKLRTVKFSDPGPTLLDVYAVLETHSVMFPLYKVFTTMCYWYADSTFEVLIDLSENKEPIENINGSLQGVWTWGLIKARAHPGATRRSLNSSTHDEAFKIALVEAQAKVNKMSEQGQGQALDPNELARLPKDEQDSIKNEGWNVVLFIKLFNSMPSHDDLLATSKARVAKVLEQLDAIQNGREEAGAAERREEEAKRCREIETAIAKEEAKWKEINDDLKKKHEEQRKQIEEQRKKDAKQIEELQKKNEEKQKLIERLQRQLAQTTVAAQ